MAKAPAFDYQAKRAELDEILVLLQDESLDVDKALVTYEQGLKLITELETYLAEAQHTITKISAQFA